MSKADKKEDIENDILQCKEYILRASNRKPAEKEKTRQETNSKQPGADTHHIEELTEKAKTEQVSKKSETAESPQQKPEIPKFDLAEQILAEQRKITAARRRAPGQKITLMSRQAEQQQAANTTKATKPTHSYEDKIIAEIVAKDIERLHRGNN